MKIIEMYHVIHDVFEDVFNEPTYGNEGIWLILYLSFIMATTILCTLLITYRIVTVTRGGMGSIQSYRGVIEIIVESALIHSITLLVYVILIARESTAASYIDRIADLARVCLMFALVYAVS